MSVSLASNTGLSFEERHQLRKKIQEELKFSDSDVDYETDDIEEEEDDDEHEEKNEETELYSVEKVLGHTKVYGEVHYKVKWRGYSLDKNTWEPANHFICKGSRLAVYQYHERELLKQKLLESEGIKIEKENHVSSKIPHHKLADNFGDVKKPKIDVKALSRDSSSKNSYPTKEKIRKVPGLRPEIKAHSLHSIASSSKSGIGFKRSPTKNVPELKSTKFSSSASTSTKAKLEAIKNAIEMRRREEEKQRQEAEMEANLRMKRENDRRRQERERQEKERALLKAQKLAEKEKREAEEAEIERRRLQFIKDLCESDTDDNVAII